MTSKLTFYQCEITPEKNCVVDDLVGYLSSLTPLVVENFQYIKLDLDLYIKVNSSQVNVPKFNYNYVAVKNEDVNKVYYYFIIGSPTWISQHTIQLQLSLDTLNTFQNDLTWTNKTNITRQHKDRFNTTYTTTAQGKVLNRKIDGYDEGFAPVKYYASGTSIRSSSADYDFYLIYRNKESLNASSTVPIECYLCASEEINLNISVNSNGIQFNNYNIGDSLYTFEKDNAPFTTTINGVSYTIGGSSQYKGIAFFRLENGTNIAHVLKEDGSNIITNIGNTALTDVTATVKVRVCRSFIPEVDGASQYTYYSVLGQVEARNYSTITIGQTSATLLSIDSVDRTDSRIVKIIKMPYAPFTLDFVNGKLRIPAGWTYSGGYLLLNDLNTEFLNIISGNDDFSDYVSLTVVPSDIGKNKTNNIKFESKLYNSSFFSLKYIYDNFEKEFLLERYTARTAFPGVMINFKQSNNISSNSIFKFDSVNGTYKEPTLYGQYLNVNRQNEVALYNSDYLTYIRNGYNYDKKAKAQQLGAGLAGVALGALGAAASVFMPAAGVVGAAGAISFGTSTISSIVSVINTAISNEQAIQQKLENAKKSAASVSNTEDLNLLSYYNGNRLIKYTEDINENIKKSLYDLFRLTGYACNDYAVPAVNSRLYYNFLQCKADFEDTNWTYGKAFLDDIKAKYEIGVTYFHKVDGSYDWPQEKENFEIWMIEI